MLTGARHNDFFILNICICFNIHVLKRKKIPVSCENVAGLLPSISSSMEKKLNFNRETN